VVGEPTSLAVVTAHKGQIYLRLTARGRAAHTSVPEHGQNAIYAMAEVVRLLERRAAAGDLGRPHPLCGPPLLTVSVISGGVSEHIVPDHCEIAMDLRTLPGQTTAGVLRQISDWLDEDLPAALRARISLAPPHHDAPPMETAVAHPLVQGLARAVERVLGRAELGGVSYNTDGGVLAAAGVPVAVFGPGDIAQAHSPGEFVEISQVVAAAEILEGFLTEAAT
jgi:acetylornithine deacetylase